MRRGWRTRRTSRRSAAVLETTAGHRRAVRLARLRPRLGRVCHGSGRPPPAVARPWGGRKTALSGLPIHARGGRGTRSPTQAVALMIEIARLAGPGRASDSEDAPEGKPFDKHSPAQRIPFVEKRAMTRSAWRGRGGCDQLVAGERSTDPLPGSNGLRPCDARTSSVSIRSSRLAVLRRRSHGREEDPLQAVKLDRRPFSENDALELPSPARRACSRAFGLQRWGNIEPFAFRFPGSAPPIFTACSKRYGGRRGSCVEDRSQASAARRCAARSIWADRLRLARLRGTAQRACLSSPRRSTG